MASRDSLTDKRPPTMAHRPKQSVKSELPVLPKRPLKPIKPKLAQRPKKPKQAEKPVPFKQPDRHPGTTTPAKPNRKPPKPYRG